METALRRVMPAQTEAALLAKNMAMSGVVPPPMRG